MKAAIDIRHRLADQCAVVDVADYDFTVGAGTISLSGREIIDDPDLVTGGIQCPGEFGAYESQSSGDQIT
jgi:hypothetical protein